LYNI
jgi:hypothetical protein